MPQRANPAQLCQPTFGMPAVGSHREKLLRVLADQRARVSSDVLNAVFAKPALDLRDRVAVFFRMLILIAQPRLPPRRLVPPITQHRIERD